MSQRSVLARLEDILDNIGLAKLIVGGRQLEEFVKDRSLQLAVERAIEIVSEATRYVPEDMRGKHPHVPWRNIMDTGNWLRHAYQRIDPELIWGIVDRDLDVLKPVVEAMRAAEMARQTAISHSGLAPGSQNIGPNPQTRIDRRFAALKAEGRPALVTFVTAGDPDMATTAKILAGLPAAGADVIELGMVFSDPMADGPAIQASGQRALKGGYKLSKVLDLVRDLRRTDDTTPVVLMGYYNPIYVYPAETFLTEAAAAGVDGLIVVDMPPEADDELCLPAMRHGLNFVRLATPTTDDRRLPAVLANTSGFLYYVAVAGITGTKTAVASSVHEQVKRIKRQTTLPVAVGFGIRTPAQARAMAAGADGVVVGTAIVEAIGNSLSAKGKATPQTVPAVLGLVRELAGALRG